MKYLEAKRLTESFENKMMPGSRSDQDGGQSAVENKAADVEYRNEVVTLADELQVDLSTIKGTGKNGKILIRDVRNAAQQKESEE
jgi:pyruvate/2-oxoglutarate dehydrogenase complex dihydrolipoamide acyltransferase (E2) component